MMGALYEKPRSAVLCLHILKQTWQASILTQKDLAKLVELIYSYDYRKSSARNNLQCVCRLEETLAMVERAIEGQRNILKNVFRGYDTTWSDERTVGELMSYWQKIYAASDNMRSDVRALRFFDERLREYCGRLFVDRAEAELRQ